MNSKEKKAVMPWEEVNPDNGIHLMAKRNGYVCPIRHNYEGSKEQEGTRGISLFVKKRRNPEFC